MRVLIIATATAALAACGGTGFTAGIQQTINMHLGKVTSSCNTIGASTGTPNTDGSTTSFVHQPQGGDCVMTAQWRGPMINMGKLRDQIGRDEPTAEKDLHGLSIKHFDVDISHVSLRDNDNNAVLNVPDSAIVNYHETVGLTGAKIVTLDFINDNASSADNAGSNPNHPNESLQDSAALIDAANAGLGSNTDIMGVGSATLTADMSHIAGFVEAKDPVLRLELDYDVTGGDQD